MLKRIKESADYIAKQISITPKIGLILGSGLGAFETEIELENKIPYSSIPHFPVSGVEGHKGTLLIGRIKGRPVAVMQGRVHYYEGYSMDEVTYPVKVLKQMGISHLLLTNASGGLNPEFEVGDLMIIEDHINLMPNPLIGKNEEKLGPRFPDMSEAYSKGLIEKAKSIAGTQNIDIKQGVYVAVTGPTYETPAEYKYLRIIGADAVGMSTVPEVIVARHMNINCFAVSVITDLGVPGKVEFITHDQVQAVASTSEPKLAALLRDLIANI